MNKDERPVMVTIRCITYNHERYIRQCLDGFVMQKTNFRFEIVIHDDASTDRTAEIIREYVNKYPELFVPIFEEENQYNNWEHVVELINAKIRGKYIAMCEGDDYWTDPYKLQKQVDAMEKHNQCTICFCKVQKINKYGSKLSATIPYKKHIKKEIIQLSDYLYEEFYVGRWTFHTSSFLFRKTMLKEIDRNMAGVFRDFPFGDMPMLLTCLMNGKGFYVNDVCSCYRVLSGGYNSKMKANPEFAVKDELKFMESIKQFNTFTELKYDKYIQRKLSRCKLRICILEGKYDEVLSIRNYWYWYNKPLLLLSLICKRFFPNLYFRLKDALKR